MCENLQQSSNTDSPSILQDVCGYKTLSTNGWSKCEQACKPTECCFVDCDNGLPGSVNCMEYDRYFFLYESPTSIKESPQQAPTRRNNDLKDSDKIYLVAKACGKDNIVTSEGHAACYDLCNERSCCFFLNFLIVTILNKIGVMNISFVKI